MHPRSIFRTVACVVAIAAVNASAQRVDVKLLSSVPPGDTAPAGTNVAWRQKHCRFGASHVAFVSQAPNLVDGQNDSNNAADTFVFDLRSGTLALASRSRFPTSTPRSHTYPVATSASGVVLLWTYASDFGSGFQDANAGQTDLYLFDPTLGTTTLVSRAAGSDFTTANAGSMGADISSDGNWALFESEASDIVSDAYRPNGLKQVYLFERTSGKNVLVSRAAGSELAYANGESSASAISADGRFVLFESSADDLVEGQVDSPGTPDIFLYEHAAGRVTLVTHAPDAHNVALGEYAVPVAISADGGQILFYGSAPDVVADVKDQNNDFDAFLFDRLLGTNLLVSRAEGSSTVTPGGGSIPVAMSADGERVLFQSHATNIIPGGVDPHYGADVFVFERATQRTTLVSRSFESPGVTASGNAQAVDIRPDGRQVLFHSSSPNLVEGITDTNLSTDAFLFDVEHETTTLLSRKTATAAVTSANAASRPIAFLGSGRLLLQSSASDLVSGVDDQNGVDDVLVMDLRDGSIRYLAYAIGEVTATGNGPSGATAMSDDARRVLLTTEASNLDPAVTDRNEGSDVFLNFVGGRKQLITHALDSPFTTANSYSHSAAMTPDGNRILFGSHAWNIVPNDRNSWNSDAFLFDVTTDSTTLVSRAADAVFTTNGDSFGRGISTDGSAVVFESNGTNVVRGMQNPDRAFAVFGFDVVRQETTLVSHVDGSATTAASRGWVASSEISGDGRWIIFDGYASDILPDMIDENPWNDVYLYDRASGAIRLISHAAGSPNTTGNHASTGVSINHDGSLILFSSAASNLIPGLIDDNGAQDAFVYDRIHDSTTLVSRFWGSPSVTPGGGSYPVALSADGRIVLYQSSANDVIAGVFDDNDQPDVFLFDRISGTTTLVSRAFDSESRTADHRSDPVGLSADSSVVLFTSRASNLIEALIDSNGQYRSDVFVFDRARARTTLLSRSVRNPLVTGNGESLARAISPDGTHILLISEASDLVNAVDVNRDLDAFLVSFDRDGVFANGFE